jgi:hypothetical protein
MIFTRETYLKMMDLIHLAIKEDRVVTVDDSLSISVSYSSLISLFSQYYLRENSSRKEFQHPEYTSFTKFKSNLLNIVHINNTSLVQISKEAKISFYRLAKIYIEERFSNQMKISDFLLNPQIISEEVIRNELLYMIANDIADSPNISIIKESMGKEYEQLLTVLLNKYHFIYETEGEMRKKGKPKTPDIWFTIPMATLCSKYETMHLQYYRSSDHLEGEEEDIFGNNYHARYFSDEGQSQLHASDESSSYLKDFPSLASGEPQPSQLLLSPSAAAPNTLFNSIASPSNDLNPTEDNYVIINWIDSKAMFADLETFQEHYQQLHGYYLRYGRGMVIYWHGLVEDIYQSELYDGNIIIRDSFPEKWIFPTGELADGIHPPSFELNLDVLP